MTSGRALHPRFLSLCLMLSMGACATEHIGGPPAPGPQPVTPGPAVGDLPVAGPTAMSGGYLWNFDEGPPGRLPEVFSAEVGDWQFEEEAEAPSGCCVLAQKASSPSSVFNLVLIDSAPLADVDISVNVRARHGRVDRGGGVVWRARDAHNYYIARYNPLEENYRVYVVQDGERRQLESADVRLDPQAWHVLRVRMVGDHIECFLDGQQYLEARDGTFAAPGRVGLWTKADAQTQFDDLSLNTLGAHALDDGAIGELMGVPTTTTADGVVRVSWPRTDVPVTVDGMSFNPGAGLTSWAAFAQAAEGAMLMGDTVLFQDEVSPAMDAAFEHGLEITALHNHFFYDEPRVYFMHIGGHGDAASLARGVRAVWDSARELRRRSPKPAVSFGGTTPTAGAFDADAISRIAGIPASQQEGIVKVMLGREAMMDGARFGGSMGLTTWAAFSGSDALAVIDGDFAMTADEVQPVLRALRRAGIHVVALHNHMVAEDPAYYFLHFWGKGSSTDLARGFRSALDAQREFGRRTHGQRGYRGDS